MLTWNAASATRADRFADLMEANVAIASTSVPMAVANEAMVAQSVDANTIRKTTARNFVSSRRPHCWQTHVMLDHVSIQCADIEKSAAFYDAVLAPLAGTRVMEFDEAIGYGIPPMPTFWIGRQQTGDGFRESHLAFTAPTRGAVRAVHDHVVAAGGVVLHPPRAWPHD